MCCKSRGGRGQVRDEKEADHEEKNNNSCSPLVCCRRSFCLCLRKLQVSGILPFPGAGAKKTGGAVRGSERGSGSGSKTGCLGCKGADRKRSEALF